MLAVRLLSALVCGLGLMSCTASDPASGVARSSLAGSDVFSDLTARQPVDRAIDRANSGAAVPVDRSVGRTLSFGPAEPTSTAAVSGASAVIGADDLEEGGGYKLNFDRAEIRDVARAVLNDMLGLNYTIGADVSGKITISSARPLSRKELLSTLEIVLAGQGFAMTNTGGSYRIAASGAGGGALDFDAGQQPGYGVSIVPLRHVSAGIMSRLLSGFIAEADRVKVDIANNAMVVRGPGAKREEAVQAILAFDADWMRGQSVSLFEVRRARPEAVITELSQIFDSGENGASTGVIQFKPIGRMRAILAVSKNPALIKRAETYIRRLDGESAGAAENVFIYRARYHDAKELARIVTSLFAAGGDAGGRGASSLGDRGGGGPALSPNGESGDGTIVSPSGNGGRQASSLPMGGNAPARFAAAFGDKVAPASGGDSYPPAVPDVLDLTRQSRGSGAQKISISADVSNNSVVTYADGDTYKKIHAALRQLDSTPLQVAVNVMIAEVQLKDELRFGIQYFLGSEKAGLGKNKGSISLFSQAANVLQKQIPGFNFLAGANATPDIILSALDGITDVKVLSSPSLVVLENKTATLQVGDAVPITTRQAQSVENLNAPLINQVEFRDTGIILNVTPRIGQNDAVTMKIEQEISSVTSAADTLTPTISKRKVASNISVVSGQTVLLAGLISEKQQNGRSGIPILGRIPVLGDLVSQTDNGSARTELVVFIRPVVIRSGEDAQTVAEEFRSRLVSVGTQPPRVNRPPPALKQPLVAKY